MYYNDILLLLVHSLGTPHLDRAGNLLLAVGLEHIAVHKEWAHLTSRCDWCIGAYKAGSTLAPGALHEG